MSIKNEYMKYFEYSETCCNFVFDVVIVRCAFEVWQTLHFINLIFNGCFISLVGAFFQLLFFKITLVLL